jgi:hypothetical protein
VAAVFSGDAQAATPTSPAVARPATRSMARRLVREANGARSAEGNFVIGVVLSLCCDVTA